MYKIILIAIILIISIYYLNNYFNNYFNNKYYTEGKKIIEKLREKKSNDETFNSIKKYYINLERSKDRKESIEKEFQLYGIENYQRVEGCDGKNLVNNKKGSFGDLEFENKKDNKINKHEISTTCSHLKAIKKVYDDGEDLAIIMEDDLKFTLMPYWKKDLKSIINNLPKDLEILQLSSGKTPKNIDVILSRNKYPEKDQKYKDRDTGYTFSCICYLINKKGMKKIIDKFFKGNKIVYDLKDCTADISVILPSVKTYYLEQNLFPLDSFEFKTTIHKNNTNNYYESLQSLKFYNKNV